MRKITDTSESPLQIYEIIRNYFQLKTMKTRIQLMDPIVKKLDAKFELKAIKLLWHIQNELSKIPKSKSFDERQSIDLYYKDPAIIEMLGTNRNNFYKVLNHLVDHDILRLYKGPTTYFVSPLYIDNLTEKHWAEYREYVRIKRSEHVSEKFSKDMTRYMHENGLGHLLNDAVPPQPPAVE